MAVLEKVFVLIDNHANKIRSLNIRIFIEFLDYIYFIRIAFIVKGVCYYINTFSADIIKIHNASAATHLGRHYFISLEIINKHLYDVLYTGIYYGERKNVFTQRHK